MKKCRTNAEIANFIIGCSDASQLQDEIQAIINDEPLDVDRLEPRLREAIGAVNESCRNGSVYLNRLRYGARISHPTASTDFRIKPPVPDRPSHARPSLYLRHIVPLGSPDSCATGRVGRRSSCHVCRVVCAPHDDVRRQRPRAQIAVLTAWVISSWTVKMSVTFAS
jgi:hypothetical protein